MRDHDDLTDRLTQLGSAPVPDDVRDGHLHAMRAATPVPESPRRFGKLAVAAAALVGFAAGSTGFAMAGALPDPAQGVAHDVLAVIQVEVPDSGWKNHGHCVSTYAQAGDEAGKGTCKDQAPPGRSGEAPGRRGEAPGQKDLPADHPNFVTDDCKGKPPWAGKDGDKDPQVREDHLATCAAERNADEDPSAEAAEDAAERQAEELEEQQEAEAEAREEAEERQAEAQGQPEPPVPAEPGPPELTDPARDEAPGDVPAGGEPQPETTPEDAPAG